MIRTDHTDDLTPRAADDCTCIYPSRVVSPMRCDACVNAAVLADAETGQLGTYVAERLTVVLFLLDGTGRDHLPACILEELVADLAAHRADDRALRTVLEQRAGYAAQLRDRAARRQLLDAHRRPA